MLSRNHASRFAREADALAFAGIDHKVVVPAVITPRPCKAMPEDAAFQIFAKRLTDIGLGSVVVALTMGISSSELEQPWFIQKNPDDA